MTRIDQLQPDYIMDENGHKKSVILSVEHFEELLQDLEDLAAVAERRDEPTVSHKDIIQDLKKNGIIQN